jgi:hypothetical protein
MLYPLSYERRSRSVYARGRSIRRCDAAGLIVNPGFFLLSARQLLAPTPAAASAPA